MYETRNETNRCRSHVARGRSKRPDLPLLRRGIVLSLMSDAVALVVDNLLLWLLHS
jgi:hypothetical protein